MSVMNIVIRHSRQHLHIVLILHINNSQSVFIVAEADFSSLIISIWTFVNHTLSIVDIAILSETASKLRVEWIFHINNVKSTGASATAHRVHKSSFLVQDNVVGATKFVIVGRLLEKIDTRFSCFEISQLSEVIDLQSMVKCLTPNESMISIDLFNLLINNDS